MKTITLSEALGNSQLIELIKNQIGEVSIDESGLATADKSLLYKFKDSSALEDCNVMKQGLYKCLYASTANMPNESRGAAILVCLNAYFGDAYKIQFMCNLNNRNLYYRTKVDANWMEWKRITFME